jgi:hypothetical protein
LVVPTRPDRRRGFRLTFERGSVAWIENHVRVERGKNPLFEPLAEVRTQTCRERSEFLRLEISSFNTRSNLITLAGYRGSRLKPDHHSPADAAGRFRTTRWSVVLFSAQIAEGRVGP